MPRKKPYPNPKFKDSTLPTTVRTLMTKAEEIAITDDFRLLPEALDFKEQMRTNDAAVKAAKKALQNAYLTQNERRRLEGDLMHAEQEASRCRHECNEWKLQTWRIPTHLLESDGWILHESCR